MSEARTTIAHLTLKTSMCSSHTATSDTSASAATRGALAGLGRHAHSTSAPAVPHFRKHLRQGKGSAFEKCSPKFIHSSCPAPSSIHRLFFCVTQVACAHQSAWRTPPLRSSFFNNFISIVLLSSSHRLFHHTVTTPLAVQSSDDMFCSAGRIKLPRRHW